MNKVKLLLIGLVTILAASLVLWYVYVNYFKPESFTDNCLKEGRSSWVCTQLFVDKGLLEPSACESVPQEKARGACYYRAALNQSNRTWCDKITDQNWSKTCNIVLQKDPSNCEELRAGPFGSANVIDCLKDVAKLNNDSGLCDGLDSRYHRVDCYVFLAYYQKNIQICEKLSKPEEVADCKMQYNNLIEGY